jgi:hypothetical protein
MNDEVGVRVLRCAQHLQEKLQASPQSPPPPVAVTGDLLALDVL